MSSMSSQGWFLAVALAALGCESAAPVAVVDSGTREDAASDATTNDEPDAADAGAIDASDGGFCAGDPRLRVCGEGQCVNLDESPSHCGGCGNSCLARPNVDQRSACVAGVCQNLCLSGWGDCDGNPGNGCEVPLDTRERCGACGNRCPDDRPQCVTQLRPDGTPAWSCQSDCGADPCTAACAGTCRNLCSDRNHCGACGARCEARPHAEARCDVRRCLYACLTGWGDCNGDGSGGDADGCESDLTIATAHCGACGRACPAGATCRGGFCGCGGTRFSCNRVAADGCESNVAEDIDNCGGCGLRCARPAGSSTPVCTAGVCSTRLLCGVRYGACDRDLVSCESRLDANPDHCGACGRRCADFPGGAGSCVASVCTYRCDATTGAQDCDGSLANGCEVNVLGDPSNCGRCGSRCPSPEHGAATCQRGSCTFLCAPGYARVEGRCISAGAGAAPPRAIGPLSGSFVSTPTPLLSWVERPGARADDAVVQICRQRDCRPENVEQVFALGGREGTPPVALSPGSHFWRLYAIDRSAGTEAVGAVPSPTWELLVTTSRPTGHGLAWGQSPDLDGDGLAETIVGVADDHRVDIIRGQGSLPSTRTTRTSLEGPAGTRFGIAVAAAGDLDGDGFGDLLIGAPDVRSTSGNGRVFVLYGAATLPPTDVFTNPATRDRWRAVDGVGNGLFGAAVAGAGDVNHDGFADFVVGAPALLIPGRGTGAAYLSLGKTRASASPELDTFERIELVAPDQPGSFGSVVVGVGDTDGDGFGDVAVGDPDFNAGAGRVALFRGCRTPGTCAGGPAPAIETLPNVSTVTHLRFGASVASAGDFDGNGLADLVVGSPGGPGVVEVYRGRPAAALFPALNLQALDDAPVGFGTAVAGGDFDGDGLGDVAVASRASDRVARYRGTAAGTPALATACQRPGVPVFGRALAVPGNIDGAGGMDLVVSSLAGADLDRGTVWVCVSATASGALEVGSGGVSYGRSVE